MAKQKSFKNSPAMQFLSIAPPPAEEKPRAVKAAAETPGAPPAPKPGPAAPARPAAKAAAEAPAAQQTTAQPAPEMGQGSYPMKPNPAYIETRSKRVQLLLQPSLHARLKTLAAGRDVSFNDLVHSVLEEYSAHNRA